MTPNHEVPDRLEKHRVVVIVVDMQERFRDLIHGMNEVTRASSRLIRFCSNSRSP